MFGKWWFSVPIIPSTFIEILLWRRVLPSPPFIYLISYLYQCGFLDIYFTDYNHCYNLVSHAVLGMAIGPAFKLASCVLLTSFCHEYFFRKCPCPLLVLLSAISPRSFGSFYWGMVFRNQDCGHKMYSLLLGIWGRFWWLDEDWKWKLSFQVSEGYSLGKHPGFL